MAKFRVFVSRTQLANFEVVADTSTEAWDQALERLHYGLDDELFENCESVDEIENIEETEPNYPITTGRGVRDAFWDGYPQYTEVPAWEQNDYPVDIRTAFVDFVDHLQKSGQISEELASDVTL